MPSNATGSVRNGTHAVSLHPQAERQSVQPPTQRPAVYGPSSAVLYYLGHVLLEHTVSVPTQHPVNVAEALTYVLLDSLVFVCAMDL